MTPEQLAKYLKFVAAIGEPLIDLFEYSQRDEAELDPEEEKQIAMRIIRKSAEERVRRSIEGGA